SGRKRPRTHRKRDDRTQPPRIAPLIFADLTDTEVLTEDWALRTDFDREHLTEIDTAELDLDDVTFTECHVVGWNAHRTNFQGARFLQTRIERLNAPSLRARRTTWREVELLASRIGAAEWYDSDLSQVEISHSKLGWLNLRASHLTDVVLRDSRIEELDLSGATLD
ncbi:pentapeptide repeat-containing protein, partial [Isoptericola sp. NPDC056134]|uniref:pentapeptide repeat-containing protein n=1 Tax=Isoptericola sp. NPDC056134 TaxID=3345723 RepID=UPI0035E5F008